MSALTTEHHRRLHRFVRLLQGTQTLPDVSKALVDGVGKTIFADVAATYRVDSASGQVLDVYSDADTRFLNDYESHCRSKDPMLEYVVRQGRAVDSTRATTRRSWEDTANCALLRSAGLEFSLTAPISVSGVLLGTINLARAASTGKFTPAELMVADLMGEQVALAIERAVRFELSDQRVSILERALDRVPEAVIVTDLEARVLFLNRAARRDSSLVDPAGGGLATGLTVADAICGALESFRKYGQRVQVTRLQDDDGQRVVKSCRLGTSVNAAVTMVSDPRSTSEVRKMPAWDVLTKREQEITQLVAEGLTAKEVAQRAFITENTVKQHLKRVFAKTGARNKAELVQLIWSAGHATRRGEPQASPPRANPVVP